MKNSFPCLQNGKNGRTKMDYSIYCLKKSLGFKAEVKILAEFFFVANAIIRSELSEG